MYKSLNLKKIRIYLSLFLLYFFFLWREWKGQDLLLLIIPGLIAGHILHNLFFERKHFNFSLILSIIAAVAVLSHFIFRYPTWIAFYVFMGAFVFSFCIDFIGFSERKRNRLIQEKIKEL